MLRSFKYATNALKQFCHERVKIRALAGVVHYFTCMQLLLYCFYNYIFTLGGSLPEPTLSNFLCESFNWTDSAYTRQSGRKPNMWQPCLPLPVSCQICRIAK